MGVDRTAVAADDGGAGLGFQSASSPGWREVMDLYRFSNPARSNLSMSFSIRGFKNMFG